MYFDDRESGDDIMFDCSTVPSTNPPGYDTCTIDAEICTCKVDPTNPFAMITYAPPAGVITCPTRLGPYTSCTFDGTDCICTKPLRTEDLNNNGFCLDYIVT